MMTILNFIWAIAWPWGVLLFLARGWWQESSLLEKYQEQGVKDAKQFRSDISQSAAKEEILEARITELKARVSAGAEPYRKQLNEQAEVISFYTQQIQELKKQLAATRVEAQRTPLGKLLNLRGMGGGQ